MKYSDYRSIDFDDAIQYGEYIAEHLDKTIQYAEYLSENLDGYGISGISIKKKELISKIDKIYGEDQKN